MTSRFNFFLKNYSIADIAGLAPNGGAVAAYVPDTLMEDVVDTSTIDVQSDHHFRCQNQISWGEVIPNSGN